MIKFKGFLKLILILLTTKLACNFSQLTNEECVVDNSQSFLKTFTGLQIEKKSFESYEKYTLYEESKNFLVSAKYFKCNNLSKINTCAIYLRVDDSFPRYVFVDHCYGKSNRSIEFKYFDNDLIKKDVLTKGNFPLLNCNNTINNESNETHWEKIEKFRYHFQCAQLMGGEFAVTIIRTTFNNSIAQLKVEHNEDGIIKVSIKSSSYDKNTGNSSNSGVCGMKNAQCIQSLHLNTTLSNNGTIENFFNTTINGTIDNLCNVTIDGTIETSFNTTINGTIDTLCNEAINGTIDNLCNVTINGTIETSFNTTINRTIDNLCDATINGTIENPCDVAINGTIDTLCNETINGTIGNLCNVTINGTIETSFNTTINGTIETSFNTTINGTIGNPCNVTINSTNFRTIPRYNWTLDLTKHTTEHECNFFNYDKEIKTFSGQMIKTSTFIEHKRNIVLYNYKKKLMVTTKFRMCKTTDYNSPRYCSCSFYVRVNTQNNSHFAYIDYCNLENTSTALKYFNSETRNDRSKYKDLDCNKKFENENDEDWSRVPVSQGFFKCAKLKTDDSDTFLITTVGLQFNIRVKVELKSDGIVDPLNELTINPALVSEENTEGLCGKWSNAGEIECNYIEKDECIKLDNVKKILDHWSMSRFYDEDYIWHDECDGSDIIVPVAGDDEEIPPPPPPVQPDPIEKNRFCYSYNDPHMKSTAGRYFEFQSAGNYILYEMGKVLFISASFRDCGLTAKCNCAVFISANFDKYVKDSAFIDLCDAEYSLKFDIGPNIYSKEKCANSEAQSYDQIFNVSYWEDKRELTETNLGAELKIDCAVIPLSRSAGKITSGNFFYKIRHTTKNMYDVIVEAQVFGNWINFIKIYPSKNSYSNFTTFLNENNQTITEFVTRSGGLCGRWFQGTNLENCDLHIGNPSYQSSCVPYGHEMSPEAVGFWNADNYDPVNYSGLKSNNGLSAKYSAKLNIINKLDTLRRLVDIPFVRSIDHSEAEEICRSRLSYKKKVVYRDLDSFLENTIRMCIEDLKMTGSVEEWVEMHNNVLKEELIKTILNDRSNFDENGILLDKTLDDYGINCINDCSGNGACTKNLFCKFGTHCNNIVSCTCDENFGNVDCSIDLRISPTFKLAETCCDSRTMNCSVFHGIGSKFSTIDTILYKILLLTTDKDKNDDSVFYSGIARVTDPKHIELDYPFGYLSKIRLNHVIARIGISYGKSDYFWQNVTFFDSLCRTCNSSTGLIDLDLISLGTCISESGKCRKINNGKCKDTVPCVGAMDLGVLVQTSRRATESEYEMEKNAIADIIGNLNLGSDKVQTGFMYYSKRSRTTLSLSKKDQVNKKRAFYVDRIKSLPYLPFFNTPLVGAFQMSSERMFFNREDGTLVPRVALLFNDNKGEDTLDSIIEEANKFKSKGIEVFTIGIGAAVDSEHSQQLNILASDSNHVMRVRNHESIYESIGEILTRICTIHAKINLDQEVSLINVGKNDYRYFKVDLQNLISTTFIIETIEPIGLVNVYYSFDELNPTLENSDSFYRKKSKRETNTKSGGNLYLFDSPSMDVKTLYLTVAGVDKTNEMKFTVSNLSY